jgi:hypothetical protein
MNKHIVQLIRERIYPLVRFCGPQSAGEVEIQGVRATVYLGELSTWLWPAKGSQTKPVTCETPHSSQNRAWATLPTGSHRRDQTEIY